MIGGPADFARHAGLQWALRRSRSRLGETPQGPARTMADGRPVIIVGMHRSGTSILTRILEQLGVFMGAQQGASTSEARFFAWQNEIFFRMASASWDAPDPLIDLLGDERWRTEFAGVAHSWMTPSWSRMYWGVRGPEAREPVPGWGWKDPRNGLALTVWMKVFPDARVVNIERDPVAVAESLRARSASLLGSPSGTSLRTLDLEQGVRLHELYTSTTRLNLSDVDESQQLDVRYEELVAEPTRVVRQVAGFCGLASGDGDIDRAAALIRDRSDRGAEARC